MTNAMAVAAVKLRQLVRLLSYTVVLVSLSARPLGATASGTLCEEVAQRSQMSRRYELAGQTEPGLAVSLELNGRPVGAVAADARGAFRFGSLLLDEGLNILKVTSTDKAGNQRVEVRRVFVDSLAPTWRFESPPDHFRTKERQLTIVGVGEPGAVVTFAEDDGKRTEVVLPSSGRVYFHVSNLAYGEHRFAVRVRDKLGNASTGTLTVTVKPPPPLELLPGWKGDRTRERALELAGRTEPGAIAILYDGGRRVDQQAVGAEGRFRFRLSDLDYGVHRLAVVASDDVRNETRREVAVTVKAPPVLVVDKTWDGRTTAAQRLVIAGRSEPGATLALYDDAVLLEAGRLAAAADFRFDVRDLPYGTHTLRVVASDDVGNVVRDQVTVVVKPPPPLEIEGAWDPRVVLERQVDLSGRSEPGATITIYVDGRPVAPLSVGAAGTFSVSLTELAYGDHALEVIATDQVGSSVRRVAHLRVASPLVLDAPLAGALLSRNQVAVSGTALAGVPVTLSVNGVETARTVAADARRPCAAPGEFDFDRVLLQEGRNSISVRADPGEGVQQETSVSLDVDTAPPPLEVDSPQGPWRSRGPTVAVSLRTEPGAEVRLSVWDREVATRLAPDSGRLEFQGVPLPKDANLLVLVARDAAGNETTVRRWVWRGVVLLDDN
jgi:antitoxin (DNA-binding transcriptional repressor) of toxin-antitoxin stability system